MNSLIDFVISVVGIAVLLFIGAAGLILFMAVASLPFLLLGVIVTGLFRIIQFLIGMA